MKIPRPKTRPKEVIDAMKIDRLRAFMTRDKDRPRLQVAMDTDDGLTGWGECYNHGPDRALAPYDPVFFEEPIRPENVEVWGDIKRQMNCTLATGESLYSRFEFLRLLSVRGADIIQPAICVVGGLLEMRKIAAIAEAHYVTVAPHNPMGPLATAINLHFSAAQPNFRILEYRLPRGPNYVFQAGGDAQPAAQESEGAIYVKDPYLPKDGFLELRPDRPGWGVEIEEDDIKTDRYIHWERRVPLRPDGSTAFA